MHALAVMWNLILLSALLASQPMAEQAEAGPPVAVESRGLLMRFGGDLVIGPEEHADAVVVVDGTLRVAGTVASVLVVDGTLELDGAHVGEVVVVDGHAALLGDTEVTGDVALIGSTIAREPSVVIGGVVTTRPPWEPIGSWIFGVLLPIGLLFALLLAGLGLAALVPAGVRRVEAALTGEPGKTALAALMIWIVVPLVVALSFALVFTIPAGIGVLLFVLPAIAFFGYIVAGIRLGEGLVGLMKLTRTSARPYLAALIGIPLLFLIGRAPVLGALVTLLATLAGGGAIALVAWRTMRTRREPAPA